MIARRGEGFTSAARFAPSCPGRSGAEGGDEGKERKEDEGGRGERIHLRIAVHLQVTERAHKQRLGRTHFVPKLRERGMARARDIKVPKRRVV